MGGPAEGVRELSERAGRPRVLDLQVPLRNLPEEPQRFPSIAEAVTKPAKGRLTRLFFRVPVKGQLREDGERRLCGGASHDPLRESMKGGSEGGKNPLKGTNDTLIILLNAYVLFKGNNKDLLKLRTYIVGLEICVSSEDIKELFLPNLVILLDLLNSTCPPHNYMSIT